MAIVIPIAIATIVGGVMYFRLRANDPAYNAGQIVDAYRSNDPDRIFGFATATDLSTGGLTQEKFSRVWNDIAVPTFSKGRFTRLGSLNNLNSPPTQGTGDFYFEYAPGKEEQLGVSTYQTETGPKSPILYDLLTWIWRIEYLREHMSLDREQMNWATMRLGGLRRDKSKLERIGLLGVTSPNGSFMTWDRYETWLKKFEDH